jgi:hypothetical protein
VSARQVTLDEALATERRDRGIVRAAEGAGRLDEEWRSRMLETVRECAEALPDFICDSVWGFASPEDRAFPKPKALGAVMLAAARLGWIERTDRTRITANAARHRSPVPVWRSRIYRGRAA